MFLINTTPFLKSSICRKFLNSKQHSHHFMRTIGRWMWLSHGIPLVLQLQNGTEGVMRMSWLSIVSIVRGYHWYIHFSFPLSLNNTQFFLLIVLEELQDDYNGHSFNSFISVDSTSVLMKFVWKLFGRYHGMWLRGQNRALCFTLPYVRRILTLKVEDKKYYNFSSAAHDIIVP